MKVQAIQRARALGGEVQHIAVTLNRLRKKLGSWEMRSGAWFTRLVEDYLAHREQRIRVAELDITDEERRRRARVVVRRACGVLAATGAGSGAAWTGATASATQSGGIAGIVTIPLAGATVGAEMLFRSFVHLRMVADLAELYGYPLRPRNADDLVRLYAIALDMLAEPQGDELGRDVVERVIEMDSEEIGKAVGMKVVGESMLRNVLPYVGIATSSVANVMLTLRLADAVRREVIALAALRDVLSQLERESPDCVEPLVQGMWFLLTAEGRLSALASAVLADVVHRGSPEARRRTVAGFTETASDWTERLARASDGCARELCQFALELTTVLDGKASTAAGSLLQDASEALGRPLDPTHVEELRKRIERGVPVNC